MQGQSIRQYGKPLTRSNRYSSSRRRQVLACLRVANQSGVVPLWIAQGQARLGSGDRQGAWDDCRCALALSPQDPTAYQLRGNIRLETGDRLGAMADYFRAIKFACQGDVDATVYRDIFHKLREISKQEALSRFKDTHSSRAQKELAQMRFQIGLERASSGEYAQAIATINEALEHHPHPATLFYHRGLFWCKLDDWEAAIADFQYALKFDARHMDAYLAKGNAWFKLRNYAAAIADYTKILTYQPFNAVAYYNRAIAQTALGELNLAIQDYTDAAGIFLTIGDESGHQQARDRAERLQSTEAGAAPFLEHPIAPDSDRFDYADDRTQTIAKPEGLEFHRGSQTLQQKLLGLLHGDRRLANRLIQAAGFKFPDQSIDWYFEKVIHDLVIHDLESDRP